MSLAVTEPAFYDAAMVDPDGPAMLPLAESPWRPVYAEAASWIHPADPVVDLGCGTGRFAAELETRRHRGGFCGIDFSAAAVAEAARYVCRDGFRFEVGDLRSWQPESRRSGATVYVCLEVLEHLEDDRELASRIPPGHRLIASLPNYESEAHLRVFRGAGDVFARYERWLSFRRWSLIDLGGGRAIHLVDTMRRIDSW